MNKAVFATVLTAAAVTAPFCVATVPAAAQAGSAAPANQTAPASSGTEAPQKEATLQPDEYAAYQKVITATDPAAKAAAADAFLQKYPQSSVKAAVLEQEMAAYAQSNNPKTLDVAQQVLQVDPNNIQALVLTTTLEKAQGDAATDPSTKQSDFDKAADAATRGLAVTKPANVTDDQWKTLQAQVKPYFYSAIGADALQKKDYAGAITAYTNELQAVPPAQTQQPGPVLQDTYYLAQAYYSQQPPDYLKCSFFATRTATFAPDQYKSQFQPLANYCYRKYHGGDDGYDAVKTAAQANVMPAQDFLSSVKPAPTPADQATAVLESDKKEDPTLAKVNLEDREYVIANGTPDQAQEEFAPIKGKEVKVSGVVVSVSGTDLKLAVSDDAKNTNPPVADFDITLKSEPKTAPATGATVDVVATFDSFTQKPTMITMTGGEIQGPKEKAPVHHTTTTHHRAAH